MYWAFQELGGYKEPNPEITLVSITLLQWEAEAQRWEGP